MQSKRRAVSWFCVGAGLSLMLSACGAVEEDTEGTDNNQEADNNNQGAGNNSHEAVNNNSWGDDVANNHTGEVDQDAPNNAGYENIQCDEETNICTTCDSRDICWNYDANNPPVEEDDEENNASAGSQEPECVEHVCAYGEYQCGERGLIEVCESSRQCSQWRETLTPCEPPCGADDLDCACPERVWEGDLTAADDMEGYTIVTGSLNLLASEEWSDLSRLHCLRHIGGNMRVRGAVASLDGLSSLVSVGGYLEFEASALQNVDGLSGLQYVGLSVTMEDLVEMRNVDGLSSLVTVGRNVWLSGLRNLENLDGLSSLTSVGGTFSLLGAEKLTDVDGLSSLESVGYDLNITNNPMLQNFDGLSSLTSVGGTAIRHNTMLQNINGLSSLTTITGESQGSLYFEDNPSLTNINGLASLTSYGEGFFFFDHPLLCQDEVDALMMSLGAPQLLERYKVQGNNGLCKPLDP